MKLNLKILFYTLIFLIILILSSYFLYEYLNKSSDNIPDETEHLLGHTLTSSPMYHLNNIYHNFEISDSIIKMNLESVLDKYMNYINSKGGIKIESQGFGYKPVTRKISNRFSGAERYIYLPRLSVGSRIITSASVYSLKELFPDNSEFHKNLILSVFQRINHEGEMFCVGSSDSNDFNFYIPENNPDGTKNELISTLLQGNNFSELVKVSNKWFLNIYHPIKDNFGNINAMISAGKEIYFSEIVNNLFFDMPDLRNNNIFIMRGQAHNSDPSDSNNRKEIIYQYLHDDSTLIYSLKDSNGFSLLNSINQENVQNNLFIKEFAIKINDSSIKFRADVKYFAPWNCFISIISKNCNCKKYPVNYLNEKRLLWYEYIGIILVCLLLLIFAFIIKKLVSRQYKIFADIAESISNGSLNSALKELDDYKTNNSKAVSQKNSIAGKFYFALKQVVNNESSMRNKIENIKSELPDLDIDTGRLASVLKKHTNSIILINSLIGNMSDFNNESHLKISNLSNKLDALIHFVDRIQKMNIDIKSDDNSETSCNNVINAKVDLINNNKDNLLSLTKSLTIIKEKIHFLFLNCSISSENASSDNSLFLNLINELKDLYEEAEKLSIKTEDSITKYNDCLLAGVNTLNQLSESIRNENVKTLIERIPEIKENLDFFELDLVEVTGYVEVQSNFINQLMDAMKMLIESDELLNQTISPVITGIEFDLNEKIHKLNEIIN